MRSVDLHCHVLPGVDDGPPTLDDALDLARAATAAGTREIVATPHVNHDRFIAPRDIAPAVAALGEHVAAAGIDVAIRPGAEIALSRVFDLDEDDLRLLRLGGGPYLLLESPFASVAGSFDSIILDVQSRGHGVLLAHPERCPAFQRDPSRLAALVAGGVLVQVTAGALSGDFGRRVREFALQLLADDMVHVVASDAHDARRRPPGTLAAVRDLEPELPGVTARASWYCAEVPAAILSGSPIPASEPLPAGRARWRQRLRPASSRRSPRRRAS